MSKRISAVLLGFALILSLCAGAAYAGDFTADLVEVEDEQVVQKIYVSGQKMRFDVFDDEGSDEAATISILRLDENKYYILTPENKTFIEVPVDKSVTSIDDFNKSMLPEGSDVKKVSKGTETVGGYSAEKFEVTTTINLMGETMTMVNYEWITPEFAPLPIRVQDTEDDTVAEMRNIKAGAVDAAVFEVPEGYEKDTELEEMLKSMQQQ